MSASPSNSYDLLRLNRLLQDRWEGEPSDSCCCRVVVDAGTSAWLCRVKNNTQGSSDAQGAAGILALAIAGKLLDSG